MAKSAQTKIGCVKSFAVKCAHKCNFLRKNASFVENKCNFLTFLVQQKLALLIRNTVASDTVAAAEQTIVYLDAQGLWKPGQSFILAEFTLSLPMLSALRNWANHDRY